MAWSSAHGTNKCRTLQQWGAAHIRLEARHGGFLQNICQVSMDCCLREFGVKLCGTAQRIYWENQAIILLWIWLMSSANLKNSHGQYTETQVSRCSKIVGSVGKAIEEILQVNVIQDYIPRSPSSDGSVFPNVS